MANNAHAPIFVAFFFQRSCKVFERKRIQKKEKLFTTQDSNRFRVSRKKQACTRLHLEGEVVSDQEVLLNAWVDHFSELAKTRLNVDGVDKDLEEFVARSKNNEENILDTAFTAMEE